jgi:hypothetical protein
MSKLFLRPQRSRSHTIARVHTQPSFALPNPPIDSVQKRKTKVDILYVRDWRNVPTASMDAEVSFLPVNKAKK